MSIEKLLEKSKDFRENLDLNDVFDQLYRDQARMIEDMLSHVELQDKIISELISAITPLCDCFQTTYDGCISCRVMKNINELAREVLTDFP